jgi:hypothetical protein
VEIKEFQCLQILKIYYVTFTKLTLMKLNDHKQVESSNKSNLVTVYYHAGIMAGIWLFDIHLS